MSILLNESLDSSAASYRFISRFRSDSTDPGEQTNASSAEGPSNLTTCQQRLAGQVNVGWSGFSKPGLAIDSRDWSAQPPSSRLSSPISQETVPRRSTEQAYPVPRRSGLPPRPRPPMALKKQPCRRSIHDGSMSRVALPGNGRAIDRDHAKCPTARRKILKPSGSPRRPRVQCGAFVTVTYRSGCGIKPRTRPVSSVRPATFPMLPLGLSG